MTQFQGWRNYKNKTPHQKGRVLDFNTDQPRSKYGNKRTEVGDLKFDSKKEATRYKHLKILEDSGYIKDLRLQVPYPILVNTVKICDYIADFVYYENGMLIVEDAKGF